MRPDEIKPSRTYIGRDGERRHVDRLHPSGMGFLVIFGDRGAPLDVFAEWAVRAAGELAAVPPGDLSAEKKQRGGRGLHARAGEMNGAEGRRARELDVLKAAGEVRSWLFQPFRLSLGGGAFYTPDFLVEYSDDRVEVEEIKGHWEEAARVRIKVAADRFPWPFVSLERVGAGWKRTIFAGRGTRPSIRHGTR